MRVLRLTHFESQERCVCIRSHFRFTANPTFATVYARSSRRHAGFNMIFGRSNTTAPLPKPLVKRRASPLKEDETSDCPMEQVADENPSASQQQENVNMEQVDYDPDSDDDDDSDEEEQPLAGRPTSKAMPHPKLIPKSPPPTLRLVSKVKPAPKNILDEETESDNHPGDRPALPRRPAMRPTLTSNDRWHAPDGSDTDIRFQRESVHPGTFGNSKFLKCTNTTWSAQPSST